MATPISRPAPPAAVEESNLADATVDSEEHGGLAGYVMAAPGAVVPVAVTEPGSGFEAVAESAPAAVTPAVEEDAPAPA